MAIDWDGLVLAPCHAAFGEPAGTVTYFPQIGASFDLEGSVFDDGFHTRDLLAGPSISTSQPTLGVRLALFPAGVLPLQGDGVALRGQLYLVRDVQPDSHGEARLLLNRASLSLLPSGGSAPPAAGIVIGDYTIIEDQSGNLVIVASDGSRTPLVTKS